MSDTPTDAPRIKGLTTFDDLTQDLVWPRLFRAGVLAFHPARIVLALFGVLLTLVVFWGVLQLEQALGIGSSDPVPAGAPLIDPQNPQPAVTGAQVVSLFVQRPAHAVLNHPLGALVAFPAGLLVLLSVAAAISRSAATEFAASRAESVRDTSRFGVSRLPSLLGALAAPVILVWLVALVLAVAGFVLLQWPVVNVVGSLFYGAALVLGAMAVFLMFAYLLGAPLLVPAVCCDGADMLDAIQRAYAYVLAKPLRLLLYLAILAVQGVVLVFVVVAFCAGVVYFVATCTGAWAGDAAREMLAAGASGSGETEVAYSTGAAIVHAWNAVPRAIPGAFLFSYVACACTMLYLGMRRVCDGQDMHELWSPQEDRGHALGAGAQPSDNDADAE